MSYSLLVKEQGVGLYSDPTPIYFICLFIYPTPSKNGEIALLYLYNKIKPRYVFTKMKDDSNIFILSCMILYFI
jgi:hypothetical protein